jgi:hypothetical protein
VPITCPRGRVAHQQVLAEVVEQVDVMAGQRRVQAGAHFAREDGVPQALCRADFVLVRGPGHRDASRVQPELRFAVDRFGEVTP